MFDFSYQLSVFQQKCSRKWHTGTGLGTALPKTEILRILAGRLGLENYLELCTSWTGNFYHAIDRSAFATTRRLMYHCAADFADGLPIDYRTEGFDIAAPLAELRRDGREVDICLVDGWHTYDCTIRDVRAAYDLLPQGGIMVVHDVVPPASIASPVWHPGEWCGVAYRAYLDFVLDDPDLDYVTVNTDYGCGIVCKGSALRDMGFGSPGRIRPDLVAGWRAIAPEVDAFPYFARHYRALLRLVSAREFLRQVADRSTYGDRETAAAD